MIDQIHFVDTYAEIKAFQKFSIRPVVRKMVLDAISLRDSLKGDEPFKKPRIQFIYIHHAFRDEAGNLEHLIKFLLKHHVFINYSEAVNRILTNNIDKPYICISSDDGFKNNRRTASILESFGIKACFFICPAMISETNYINIKKFCADRLHFPPVEFLTWNEVDDLLKKGHEIGSHTMTHINIAQNPLDVIEDEINTSYRTIVERCGEVNHFAYPYGRYFHFNEAGRNLVFKAGFQSCASAERGCHVKQATAPGKESLLIRRDNIVLNWSLSHIKYFLRRNATQPFLQQNNYTY